MILNDIDLLAQSFKNCCDIDITACLVEVNTIVGKKFGMITAEFIPMNNCCLRIAKRNFVDEGVIISPPTTWNSGVDENYSRLVFEQFKECDQVSFRKFVVIANIEHNS